MNRIFQEFPAKKVIEYVEGDHNSARPEGSLMKCVMFIQTVFLKGGWDEKDLTETKMNGDASLSQKKAMMIQPKKIENEEGIDGGENFEEEKK